MPTTTPTREALASELSAPHPLFDSPRENGDDGPTQARRAAPLVLGHCTRSAREHAAGRAVIRGEARRRSIARLSVRQLELDSELEKRVKELPDWGKFVVVQGLSDA